MTLEVKTRKMLIAERRALDELAFRAGLKQRWLYLFRGGLQQDYGIRKVQKLHDYLVRSKAKGA